MVIDRLFYDHSVLSSSDESVECVLRSLGAGGTTCIAWAPEVQCKAEESVLAFLDSSRPESVDRVVAIFRADGFAEVAVIGDVRSGAPGVRVV